MPVCIGPPLGVALRTARETYETAALPLSYVGRSANTADAFKQSGVTSPAAIVVSPEQPQGHLRERRGPGPRRTGAFAEYVSGRTFVPKPAGLSFEQAAAIPVAATTALQGLRDKGGLQPGQRALINGASGGVGTFAVQIAKALGAQVTAVCSTSNVEMVRSIGADRVIDYRREDFTRSGERYDLILDIAGTRSLSACRRVLTSYGTLVVVGGPGGRWLAPADRSVKAVVMSRFVSQRMVPFLAQITKKDMVVLKELAEAGKLRAVIDRTYPLSDVPEAIRYVEAGHARGKVIISV